jgi:hypothetical protein
VTAANSPTRLLAANLASPSESNLSVRKTLTIGKKTIEKPQPGRAGLRRALWPYLIVLALLVTLVEWFTYNRRVTV